MLIEFLLIFKYGLPAKCTLHKMTSEKNMKVAVLGAAGGIGQALSLLLKTQLPAGTELALYDVAPVVPGVAVDLSHIPTAVKVEGFGADDLDKALTGADVVLIPAGVPRKPGMDRSDLFNINAGIVRNLIDAIADHAPEACIGIITNPVNTTVAIAAEALKAKGKYNPAKLFGVTTLDVIRAETFVAELKGLDVEEIVVPVIGGHSGTTILPLLSQVEGADFTQEEIEQLTHRIQNAGTEVVEAKAGGGSATLSMGLAAARFCLSLVDALNGEDDVYEYTYVEGDGEDARFFAQPVLIGKDGVKEILHYGDISEYEAKCKADMLDGLKADIKLGEDFVNNPA
ncbi:MAG: malate dehydrogenase [Psychrosphaera sp.]|jgi:malate dehydrogenase